MSWGNKLLLAFVVFCSMIFYMVYRSFKTDFDLVENDYYKNELRYQQVIDNTTRANALSSPVSVTENNNKITVQFPAEMKNKTVSGKMWFYCATDAKKDRTIEVNPDSTGLQIIDGNTLAKTNYQVKINWSAGNQNYYSEQLLKAF